MHICLYYHIVYVYVMYLSNSPETRQIYDSALIFSIYLYGLLESICICVYYINIYVHNKICMSSCYFQHEFRLAHPKIIRLCPEIQLIRCNSREIQGTLLLHSPEKKTYPNDIPMNHLAVKTLVPGWYPIMVGIAGWLFPQSYGKFLGHLTHPHHV